MLNEGLHIPDVGVVVLLRPTTSPIIFYQQIGRCMQVNAEHNPIIFDFVNNFTNIRAGDFLDDLNEAIESVDEQRTQAGLAPYEFNLHIEDKAAFIQEILDEIYDRIQPWEVGLEYLKKYVDENGNARVPYGHKTNDGFRLGAWVSNRRGEYKKGQLTEDRIKALEQIQGWVWAASQKK